MEGWIGKNGEGQRFFFQNVEFVWKYRRFFRSLLLK